MIQNKPSFKQTLIGLAFALYLPRLLYVLVRYHLLRPLLGKDNALLDATDLMRGWRGTTGMLNRRAVLCSILGPKFGKHVTVYNVLLSKASVMIGRDTYIGFDCNIGSVTIGREVVIADGVTIMSGGHQHGSAIKDQAFRSQQGKTETVTVDDGAWIGAGSIIMASIGTRAIIGTGSVVTKPVGDHEIVAGVPAKSISTSRSST